MAKLWAILRKKQKIWRDITVEVDFDDLDSAMEALSRACYELDIPRPMWLQKNENDMETFGRTFFSQDHFIESINFDRLEIEFLREKAKSPDPRNDFS